MIGQKDLEQLSMRDLAEAVALWADGFGTYEIADEIGTYEHVIYNNLPRWRLALSNAKASTDTTAATLGFHQRGFPSPSVVAVVARGIAQ